MKKYDVYLFDFDGTLVDSHESLKLVFEEAYRVLGHGGQRYGRRRGWANGEYHTGWC